MIVPILYKDKDNKAILAKAEELFKEMKLAGIRCVIDDSDNHNPGFKFNFWEVRGVPVRLELGSKDVEKSEVKCCLRHNGEKF